MQNDTKSQPTQARVAECAAFLRSFDGDSCRLVHYTGPDPLAKDLALANVLKEVEALLNEGYYVDWTAKERTLYLRVWEFGGAEPSWPLVFEEAPLN
jgi:hypothetical protein